MYSTMNAELPCPECKNKSWFETTVVANATVDPTIRDKVLSGEIFIMTCPLCNARWGMDTPMFFFDMEKNIIIFYPSSGPQGDEAIPAVLKLASDYPSTRPFTGRITSSRQDFQEKVFSLSVNLDDRVMAGLKVLIGDKVSEALKWEIGAIMLLPPTAGWDGLRFEVDSIDGKILEARVDKIAYIQVEAHFAKIGALSSQPFVVDMKWAEPLVLQMDGDEALSLIEDHLAILIPR